MVKHYKMLLFLVTVSYTVQCFLTHNVHIKNVINKCNKVNDMIRCAVGYKPPASITLNLHKTLIKLGLAEYYSPLLSLIEAHTDNFYTI